MQIILIIPSLSLSAGGAERVISMMANYWAAKGWDITLLTFDNGNWPVFYPLHANILHLPLWAVSKYPPPLGTAATIIRIIAALRREIGRRAPQAVISFMDSTNVLTLLSTMRLRVPVIVAERTNPQLNIEAGSRFWPVWSLLRRLTYPLASKVVVQTAGAGQYFFKKLPHVTAVIPNPVMISIDIKSSKNNSEQTLIAMGRLVSCKQFHLLLEAFGKVAPRHPKWNLKIFGEGLERERLEGLMHQLGVNGRIELPGVTKQPWKEMAQADLFALTSRFEGFPNVLCEAMACGLPVISFDCPFGPAEIIRNGIDGILIPPGDAAALAGALDRLMGDAALRQRLGARAPDVLERFSLEKVMSRWEAVVAEAIANS